MMWQVRFSALLAFPPSRVETTERVLREFVGFNAKAVRYTLTRRPSLLAVEEASMLAMLRSLFFSFFIFLNAKAVRYMLTRRASLLAVEEASMLALLRSLCVYDDVTYVYADVTYVYDDVTYVYDDVTYVCDDVTYVCDDVT